MIGLRVLAGLWALPGLLLGLGGLFLGLFRPTPAGFALLLIVPSLLVGLGVAIYRSDRRLSGILLIVGGFVPWATFLIIGGGYGWAAEIFVGGFILGSPPIILGGILLSELATDRKRTRQRLASQATPASDKHSEQLRN